MRFAIGVLIVGITSVAAASPGDVPPDLVQLGAVTARVYTVSVRVERPSASSWSEVVAPGSGHCRQEDAEGRVQIAGGRTRAIIESSGVYVRTGSPEFAFGRSGVACASLASLRSKHLGSVRSSGSSGGGLAVVASVTAELTTADAHRASFSVPLDRLDSYDIERPVGERRFRPARAYWLGRTFRNRTATRAIEHFYNPDLGSGRNRPSTVYSVLYGPRGASGAPDERPRDVPLQVGSQLVGEALARRTIDHFTRSHARYRWPRYSVCLVSGERAAAYPNLGEGRSPVIGFVVVTRTTLVSVSGAFRLREIPAVARRLRPLVP